MVKRRSASFRRIPPSVVRPRSHYRPDPLNPLSEASMTEMSDLHREVETAIARSSEKSKSGRYAVYVPGAVILGTFASKDGAMDVATVWADRLDGVVVVDRGLGNVER